MCEADARAAGDRAAMNEHHSCHLPKIHSLSPKDFAAFVVEDAQSDRSDRPMHLGRQADGAGYVRGPNLALVQNVRPAATGVAKKLKPELLRLGGEDALKLGQLRALFD
jgi:hypothetical protein